MFSHVQSARYFTLRITLCDSSNFKEMTFEGFREAFICSISFIIIVFLCVLGVKGTMQRPIDLQVVVLGDSNTLHGFCFLICSLL